MAGVIALSVTLADAGEMPKEHKGSAELERVKALVGTWEGKMDMGEDGESSGLHAIRLTKSQ